MQEWIDFQALRQKLTMTQVLEKFEVHFQVKGGGKQAVGPCPLSTHSGSRSGQSFSANLEKGIFQCFSCGAKGNLLDLACLLDGRNPENGEDLRKTAEMLVSHFQISFSAPAKSGQFEKPKTANAVVVNEPLDFALKNLDPTHPYLLRRGFSRETIDRFGLGFCARGYLKDRAAIPIHNPQGQLVGYAGRLTDDNTISKENPKYLFPGTRKREGKTHEFQKSLLLYNAHRMNAPLDAIVVVEGFPSVWWLTQNGYPNCVSIMGSHMSDKQKDLILDLVSKSGRIVLLADGDEAGGKLKHQAETLWAGDARFEAIQLENGAQPTSLSSAELMEFFNPAKEIAAGIRGGVSPRDDICRLIAQFSCFAHLHVSPETWDAEAFEKQAGKFSSGELSVAQFILGVWNPTTAWKCGKFDLIEAAARLDEEHRQVIINWFGNPWWP